MEILKDRLKKTIQIFRLSYTDNKGEYQQIGEEKAFIYMMKPEETAQVEGVYTKTFKMIVEKDVDIEIGDKVVDSDGNEYRVKGVEAKIDREGEIHHKEVIIELP